MHQLFRIITGKVSVELILSYSLLITLVNIALLSGCTTQQSSQPNEAFQTLSNERIGAVAWSPDGERIAFVTRPRAKTGDQEMEGPENASIWILRTKNVAAPELSKLIQLDRTTGIPTSLFWLSDACIGWASSGLVASERFRFYRLDLTGTRAEVLIDQVVDLTQSRGYGEVNAPDDVYYDSDEATLFFSGNVPYEEESVAVFKLDIASKEIIALPVGHSLHRELTLCLPGKREDYPLAYIAGRRLTDIGSEAVLLSVDHDTFDANAKVISSYAQGFIYFPRLSPDGRFLAWIRNQKANASVHELVVYRLEDNELNVVATMPFTWEGMRPAMGCPFSWSPDSNQLAYADESQIQLVSVQ